MLAKKSFRSFSRVNPKNSIFFLCDIQGVFEDKIYNMSSVVFAAKNLCKVSGILDVPLLVTEHNPKVNIGLEVRFKLG